MPVLDDKQWRLGHRRPWWQWNVLTLFVALYVLVWMRELLDIPYDATWVLCGAILFLWIVMPLVGTQPVQPRPNESRPLDNEAEIAAKSTGTRLAGWLLIALILVQSLIWGISMLMR